MLEMNTNNIEIFIERRWNDVSIEIWVFEKRPDGTNFFNFDGNEMIGTLIPEATIPSIDLKPFLKLPRYFAESFFKAISEYNSSNGIKTKDESLIEGKLLATDLHLKDMREMSSKLFDLVSNQFNSAK